MYSYWDVFFYSSLLNDGAWIFSKQSHTHTHTHTLVINSHSYSLTSKHFSRMRQSTKHHQQNRIDYVSLFSLIKGTKHNLLCNTINFRQRTCLKLVIHSPCYMLYSDGIYVFCCVYSKHVRACVVFAYTHWHVPIQITQQNTTHHNECNTL